MAQAGESGVELAFVFDEADERAEARQFGKEVIETSCCRSVAFDKEAEAVQEREDVHWDGWAGGLTVGFDPEVGVLRPGRRQGPV
jgi:hypothetical protein